MDVKHCYRPWIVQSPVLGQKQRGDAATRDDEVLGILGDWIRHDGRRYQPLFRRISSIPSDVTAAAT
jgi:hypothetical protein